MNLRPSGYEPDELPDCSTPRQYDISERLRIRVPLWQAVRDAAKAAFRCGAIGKRRLNVRFIDLAATYSPAS